MSAVKIKKHVNLRSPLFARAGCLSVNALLLLLLFFMFFACDVQRREKSHQTHRFLKLLHV